ncbi:MAG: alpha/beta hydrolase [bacterium]
MMQNLSRHKFSCLVNGLKITGYEFGQGPTCIMPSPGWGISINPYALTLHKLSQNFHLVFMNSRGSGSSDKPKTIRNYTYKEMAADINGVRQYFEKKHVWLMGHSLGGVLAMQNALDYKKNIQGLILLNTYALSDKIYFKDMEKQLYKRKNETWFDRVMSHEEKTSNLKTNKAFETYILEMLPLYFHKLQNFYDNLHYFQKSTYRLHAWRGWEASEQSSVNLLAKLARINTPTLIVSGSNDFVCSPMNSFRIKDKIPHAQLVEISETGHFPWLEKPKEFFTTIRSFMKQAG